tara:strand:- start:234 stop:479 length:246 start_codon:yes stop_codon:yes gene_type:complete
MKKLKRGDLVYLPSEVTLFKFDKGDRWGDIPFVNKTLKTPKPMTTAYVSPVIGLKKDNLCEILYNGEIWSVEANNIFLLGE